MIEPFVPPRWGAMLNRNTIKLQIVFTNILLFGDKSLTTGSIALVTNFALDIRSANAKLCFSSEVARAWIANACSDI